MKHVISNVFSICRTSLDADSKTWRLVADGLNDAAICLELALPFFVGYTTQVLCLSTAMKAIVGVAGNISIY